MIVVGRCELVEFGLVGRESVITLCSCSVSHSVGAPEPNLGSQLVFRGDLGAPLQVLSRLTLFVIG